MKEIYVVLGQTGEYSDRTEWLVKAFADENKGKELVEKASARVREIMAMPGDAYANRKNEKSEFDPDMQIDYTGTNYYLVKVDLVE